MGEELVNLTYAWRYLAAVATLALALAATAPAAHAQSTPPPDSTHSDSVASNRYLAKGNAALAAHNPDSARAAYEKALMYNTDNIEATVQMATILIQEGHGSYARDLLVFALKRHPNDPRLTHFHVVRQGADTTGAATVSP
jgi:Tfp pilus assembly protein PilF